MDIEFFFKSPKFEFLSACLTTVAKLEDKQSSARPPFYATITNSLVVRTFWGSNECVPSAPCLSLIFNQARRLLDAMKPYRGVNLPYQHQHILTSQNYLKHLRLVVLYFHNRFEAMPIIPILVD